MRRGVLVAFILVFATLVSFASANWFLGFWGGLTGQTFHNPGVTPIPLCDADGDGYCDAAVQGSCTGALDCIAYTDCNDDQSAQGVNTYPGALEVCDGFDNQCPGDPGHGQIDEGCPECTDSDEGPLAIQAITLGSVSGFVNPLDASTNFFAPDTCADALLLKENYCDVDNNAAVILYDCSNVGSEYSCNEGVCSCASVWLEQNSTCAEDVFTTTYTDATSCGNTPPSPVSYHCDEDGNGIIYDHCNLDFDEAKIDGVLIDPASDYSTLGVVEIEVIKGDSSMFFDWDFSEGPLNFCTIEIETSDSSDDLGYFIVKGTDAHDKTFSFKKMSNDSNSVCIRDDFDVSSVNDFSNDCDEGDEVLLPCPGDDGDYTCEVLDGDLRVYPLEHSGVAEFLSSECIPNWECGNWSACSDGLQTTSCVDVNECGVLTGQPSEIRPCLDESESPENSLEECTPDWVCSWGDCSEDGFKTKTCKDLNQCGSSEGKPIEDGELDKCSNNSLNLFIYGAVALLVLILAGIIVFLLRNKKKKFSGSSSPYSPSKPPVGKTPPSNPSSQSSNVARPSQRFRNPLAPLKSILGLPKSRVFTYQGYKKYK